MPPPVVIPPMPTEPVSPKPVASPSSAAAVVYAPVGEPAAGPGGPRRLVDLEAVEVADVEDDAALGRAVRRAAVAAGADREVEPVLAGERDDLPDVVGVGDPHDQRRAGVDAAEHDRPLRRRSRRRRVDDAGPRTRSGGRSGSMVRRSLT